MNKIKKISKYIYEDMVKEKSIRSYLLKILCNLKKISINRKYLDEIYESSKSSSFEMVMISNLSYEISKISESFSVEWCSSFSKEINKQMIHVRNLDWPVPVLKGEALIRDHQIFKSATFPGFSGVLTGVAKNRFSASINMTIENHGISWLSTPIAFIVREMFEECESYSDAVRFLMSSNVMAPAFVHIVGTKEASVILLVPNKKNIVVYRGRSISITNHNSNVGDEYDSEERKNMIDENLSSIKTRSQAWGLMRRFPLMSCDTQYRVLMCPDTGELIIKK